MLSFKVTGLNEVNGFLRNLPRNMRNELNKTGEQFMLDVRKSAKLRAPRDTGRLADSIKLTKEKNTIILSVESREGVFQEEGFKPHWIHSSMIENSSKLTRKGFFFVKKSTPFITPALEHNLSKLSQRLSNGTRKAINKSKRRKNA